MIFRLARDCQTVTGKGKDTTQSRGCTMTTGKAVVYARVSTDDQADKGFSLSAQVEAGRKYADLQGFTVAHELIDDGVSGALAFSERPAGATAWALLRSGKADALIVQNVDRLSRDVVDLLVTIRALLRAGVEVHCLDLGRVTSEYDIMLVIRGWQGSDERAKIRARSIRGKRQKAAEGKVVCCGTPPYGYDYLRDDKGRVENFTINEDQAAVVRLIFQWYTQGDGKTGPQSFKAIARRLSEAGVVTPGNPLLRKRAAAMWGRATIAKIARNTVYKGEWLYKATCPESGEVEQFTIQVPAIVDAATWQAAQTQTERNSRKAKRNGKRDYLLTGIVRCECGYSMAGRAMPRKNGEYLYYECGRHSVTHKGIEEGACHSKHIRADALEAATWDAILDIVSDPEGLLEKLRQAQREELEEQEPKRAELAAVDAMLIEAEAEAVEIGAALRKAEASRKATGRKGEGIVEKSLQRQQAELDERYSRLTARKEKLEAELANRRLTDETVNAIMQYAEDAAQGVDHADHALKRRILDGFGANIRVKDGRPWLDCRFPVPTLIELPMPRHHNLPDPAARWRSNGRLCRGHRGC